MAKKSLNIRSPKQTKDLYLLYRSRAKITPFVFLLCNYKYATIKGSGFEFAL